MAFQAPTVYTSYQVPDVQRSASQISQRWSHANIGAEHLLLAVASLQGSLSAHVLQQLDITFEKLETELRTLFSD